MKLPAFLPCKSLVEKCKHLRHVKLDILEIQILLIILLHLEQIVKFEVELQKPPVAPWIESEAVTF